VPVIAILGGLLAAACFATATLCSSRSSRLIPPSSVLAWVMVTGLVVTVPALLAVGPPQQVATSRWGLLGWLALSGTGNVVGLLLAYTALRTGKVAVIAPIVSTEGALAALLAVVAGEHLGTASAVLLVVIALGVTLAAAAPAGPAQVDTASPVGPVQVETASPVRRHPVVLAVLAALAFGASLFATGRASVDLPIPWVLLPARAIGVLALALPLALQGRLRLTRAAVPLVVAGGLCEVVGFGAFAVGSRHGLAVAAVLTSQFAAISGVAAYVLFRERLTRLQVSGVSIVVVGVAALTAVRA
jgi:drug/metabolite transporter (DMT)-like permease